MPGLDREAAPVGGLMTTTSTQQKNLAGLFLSTTTLTDARIEISVLSGGQPRKPSTIKKKASTMDTLKSGAKSIF